MNMEYSGMLKISIVFPVFNSLSYTKKSLNNLFQLIAKVNEKQASFYIVLVDDGSTDGTFIWVKENFPQVKLLKGNGELWWSGGINLAIRYSINELNSDYILWWNNDIIPRSDYFINLVELVINTYNDVGYVVGSKIILAQDRSVIWSMGGLFNPANGKKSMIGTGELDQLKYKSAVECDWLPGMGTITHKSIYEKIGFLDEKNFPQYHGDSDFTFRAKVNGYKVIVDPSLVIFNDTRHSGLKHDESFNRLIKSLFSIRSNFNISKDFKYYRIHSTSIRAYVVPITKHVKYIGGFVKWKILSVFNYHRKIKNK